MRILTSFCLAAALLLMAAPADAVPSREASCSSLKEKAAGRFLTCLLKADSKYERDRERGQWFRKKIRCRDSLANFFDRAERKYGGACVTRGDAPEVISDLEGIADDTTRWIRTNEGDGPVEPLVTCGTGTFRDFGANTCLGNASTAPGACGNGVVDPGEDCDFGATGGQSCESLGLGYGTLACGAGCRLDLSGCANTTGPDGRFQVNSNGTVTDNVLNLQWEAKYDVRTIQHRDMLFLQRNLDRIFLFQMNREGSCWADSCDWRLPTRSELVSLAGLGHLCSESGLPIELCRQNESLVYWSSTIAPSTGLQLGVTVPHGTISMLGSDDLARAIAVRSIDGSSAYGSVSQAFLQAPASLMD